MKVQQHETENVLFTPQARLIKHRAHLIQLCHNMGGGATYVSIFRHICLVCCNVYTNTHSDEQFYPDLLASLTWGVH